MVASLSLEDDMVNQASFIQELDETEQMKPK
jgi:hypothetical protein